jgi:superkiller protein 3
MAQGDRAHESKRLTSALLAYDRALELEPSRPEGHVSRGVILLEQGDRASAIAAFQRALELNPRYAVAQYWLGEGYRRSGRKSEAVRAFGRYLELSPEGAEAGAARQALQSLQE